MLHARLYPTLYIYTLHESLNAVAGLSEPCPHFCQHLGAGVTLSNDPEQLNVVDDVIRPVSIPVIIVHGLYVEPGAINDCVALLRSGLALSLTSEL